MSATDGPVCSIVSLLTTLQTGRSKVRIPAMVQQVFVLSERSRPS